ncbi:hypothetical protein EYF80_003910 [Liparis tanakae]|uniref:Uncharacterized protein n=1 Tax=Liparis tanakae TaxID=230148 RepID=A0A4Z2J7S0_9TELE|nr:hypothetical protein EYF80_003910 [Liparis tanakae]
MTLQVGMRQSKQNPGVRQLSVGEVRVSVSGERGVLGVRGEGRVSQALYPLGGGVGMVTPERWQHPSAAGLMNVNFHAPCARSSASAVKRGACSMSAVSTISMSFSLRRS